MSTHFAIFVLAAAAIGAAMADRIARRRKSPDWKASAPAAFYGAIMAAIAMTMIETIRSW